MRSLQTMYEVMIWVQDGLITIPTTLIIRSHDVGCTHLERDTYMRDDVFKTITLGGQIYYTPHSVPVWPRRKDTVRTDYTFPKHFLSGP
jgi:hypothetical protein